VTEELVIPQGLATAMVDHCLAERPNEACGVLGVAEGILTEVFPMTNVSASPVRYSLDPKEQFEVYRKLEEKGWDLGGVYHSHTRTEAWPSPTDVRMASEDVPYLIVSLAREPAAIRAFRIAKAHWADEDGEIIELAVTVR
jgi:proteasome lid subunit RPN8/RPN11